MVAPTAVRVVLVAVDPVVVPPRQTAECRGSVPLSRKAARRQAGQLDSIASREASLRSIIAPRPVDAGLVLGWILHA